MANKRKSKYPPYSQARQQALDLQLNSRQQYINWHTETKCQYLPRYPERVYKEWVSWNDWLGTANVFKGDALNQKPIRPFWEATKWAQQYAALHELDTMELWIHYWKEHQDELPEDIPMRPDQRYTEWSQIGWKGWLGTDVRGRLETAKSETALLCICSFHTLSKPGNVYAVIHAEKGEAQLRSVLERSKGLVPARIYRLMNDEKEEVLGLINKYGKKESQDGPTIPNIGDGLFIPAINDLLFELDMSLVTYRMNLTRHDEGMSPEFVEQMMLMSPGIYKHRVG